MPEQEVVPGVRRSIRARLDAFFVQDLSDRLQTDSGDAELPHLADDPGVAEPSFAGDF